MVYEMLVGLHVTNDEMYQAYREKMTPILIECGGGFGYDFRISEILKSQTDGEINRRPVARAAQRVPEVKD